VLVYQFTEPQPLIQFPHENQATVRSDTRPLEINLQRSIEQELKWLILFLTHWVPRASSSFHTRMNIDDGDDPKVRRKNLKMEMWD
jgi:hypothetical protein